MHIFREHKEATKEWVCNAACGQCRSHTHTQMMMNKTLSVWQLCQWVSGSQPIPLLPLPPTDHLDRQILDDVMIWASQQIFHLMLLGKSKCINIDSYTAHSLWDCVWWTSCDCSAVQKLWPSAPDKLLKLTDHLIWSDDLIILKWKWSTMLCSMHRMHWLSKCLLLYSSSSFCCRVHFSPCADAALLEAEVFVYLQLNESSWNIISTCFPLEYVVQKVADVIQFDSWLLMNYLIQTLKHDPHIRFYCVS